MTDSASLAVTLTGPDGQRLETLADLLRPGLRLVSIGLNPSLPSVQRGFYFANPVNRFWKAMSASRLAGRELEPGPEAIRWLFEQRDIGFTDVVKRPTAGSAALRAADFRLWAPVLLEKLERYRPGMAWFHGRVAWNRFARAVGIPFSNRNWGLQAERVADIPVFVSPNPSPANAAFSLDDLIACYNDLADRVGLS
ncbi:MAG: mismatch-specific DNA-glycosylase [Gammaproteobacteria bacterium]|nr:MAG: mismatch-specific DNA-glycosylase [Gammaproteobacteria bacterium]